MPGRIRTATNPIGMVAPSAVAANVVGAPGRDYVFTDEHHADEVKARLARFFLLGLTCT
jgi:hypothetical protein